MRASRLLPALSLALAGCSRMPWTSAHAIARAEPATAALLRSPASARFRNVTVEGGSGMRVVCGQIAGVGPNGRYGAPARFLTMADGEAAMIDPAAGDALGHPAGTAAETFESGWQSECAMNPASVYQPDALADLVDPDVGPSPSDAQAASAALDNIIGP